MQPSIRLSELIVNIFLWTFCSIIIFFGFIFVDPFILNKDFFKTVFPFLFISSYLTFFILFYLYHRKIKLVVTSILLNILFLTYFLNKYTIIELNNIVLFIIGTIIIYAIIRMGTKVILDNSTEKLEKAIKEYYAYLPAIAAFLLISISSILISIKLYMLSQIFGITGSILLIIVVLKRYMSQK